MKKFVALLLVFVLLVTVCSSAVACGPSGQKAIEEREKYFQKQLQNECDSDFANDPSYAGAYGYTYCYPRTLWDRIRGLFR